MANLKRRHAFKRWAPNIGENRDLPEPALFLEIAVGLTAKQLSDMQESIGQPLEPLPDMPEGLAPEALVEVLQGREAATMAALRARIIGGLGSYVRIHGGPHVVDGMPLVTLDDYLALAQTSADYGAEAIKELIGAVRSFNSFTGADELFSLRRSGLSASTGAVKDSPKTEGP